MDKLEMVQVANTLFKCLCRATRSLNSARDHTQLASSNAGIRYAIMATVDVGAKAVQSGLRSLRTQAL